MTEQEFIQAVQNSIDEWEKAGLRPDTLLSVEHNLREITQAVTAFATSGRRLPSVKELATIVRNLGDIDYLRSDGRGGKVRGKLQYHHSAAEISQATPAVDPRKNIPHRSKWPQITTIEGGIRFVRNTKGIPQGDLKSLNEVLAYVQAHGIHETKEPEPTLTAEQQENENAYSQAQAAVDGLTSKDVGSGLSSAARGPWTTVLRFKQQYGDYITACKKQGLSGELVLARVQEAIAKLGDGGIR